MDSLLAEVQRRYRVADMMITMHSILRDSYKRRSLALDLVIFSSSVLIAALAFGDRSLFEWLHLTADSTRLAIGLVSLVIFLSSLVAWMVDWKGKADAHDKAASAYTNTKFRLRSVDATTDVRDVEQLLSIYEETGLNTIPVPDSKFLKLKSEHLMKARLSRLLDRSPGASLCWLRFRLRLRHTRSALKETRPDI